MSVKGDSPLSNEDLLVVALNEGRRISEEKKKLLTQYLALVLRCPNLRVVKRWFCPHRKHVILMKTAKMTSLVSTPRKKVVGPQHKEHDENDENGGYHSGKTMVYRKRGFHKPENR